MINTPTNSGTVVSPRQVDLADVGEVDRGDPSCLHDQSRALPDADHGTNQLTDRLATAAPSASQSQTSSTIVQSEDARSTQQRAKNRRAQRALLALLEGDEDEQRATWDYLREELDHQRASGRKLFS